MHTLLRSTGPRRRRRHVGHCRLYIQRGRRDSPNEPGSPLGLPLGCTWVQYRQRYESSSSQTSWAHGPQTASEARALILQWYRRRMGITVVRAMARHRWRHSQYVGLTRVQLEHSRRRADQNTRGRRAGGTPLGGGSEDGAGALLPLAAGW